MRARLWEAAPALTPWGRPVSRSVRDIAEVPSLPGVVAYGATEEEAGRAALALALHVIADRMEHCE
jgi:hypothetical protein